MSEYSLDDPGFLPPVPPAPPSSSESSIEAPTDGRRKCSSCPRRMSKKSADRHTICVQCRGFDCDLNSRCDECLDWSEEEISKYAKYRKSLKSRESSSRKTSLPPPPLTPSGPSSQPSPHPAPQPAPLPAQQPAPLPAHPSAPPSATRDCLQSQMDSLAAHFTALSESLSSQLSTFMSSFGSQSRQPRLGPDAGEAHPGVTADESRMFQGEGTPSGTPLAPPPGFPNLPPGFSAPRKSSRAPHSSTHFAAPRKSARLAPQAPPPSGPAPQPSTSDWFPPDRNPTHTRHESTDSESEPSDSESVSAAADSTHSRFAALIHQICPASRPLVDPKDPRCGFESWFGQPEPSSSMRRFRMYPRVAEVQEEVAARAEALARHSRPVSRILPTRARFYALADDPLFAASQPVNSAFAQLVGQRSFAGKRWGAITFSEMERLERVFQGQLEVTSSTLWLMSGILATLKTDGFQPSDPALFNSALSSVSAALSRAARTASAGSIFLQAKRRESMLAHTTLPVPDSQKRDLTVTPGSSTGLFNSSLLAEVISQVQSSSQVSSNLALSRAFRRGRSTPSSSSPLTGPRLPSFSRGRQSTKRSSSSSRSGGRKRFRGGKVGAPSSGPSGFRKWEPSPFRTLSGGCLSLHWQAWRDRGAEPWVVEVLRFGYRLPFLSAPPLSGAPLPMPSYSPTSIKGAALEEVTLALVAKGAVELAPLPSPGFYSRLFVVWKTSGSWRPVIDLSHLNRFVDVSHFQMETIQSVLLSVRQGDWMASIDLKEAYLQVLIHPSSRHLLRFVFRDQVYQFKALCFGLSTAPQVFTRVMAPISAILHSMGIRMRRYLDDWLVQSSSRDSLVRDLQTVLSLCHELGIVVNPQKSNLVPSQIVQYLGVVIDSISFRASPSQDRISRLRSTADAFRSSASPPASLWLSLLGALSSLAHLVPGGRLRMRSLQLCLHRSWDRLDLQAPVPVSPVCLQDLQWWLHLPRLSSGVCLCQVSPDLHFWSDASDVGWGAHLDRQVASGLWDSSQAALSINARELLAVHLGLRRFQSSLRGMTVAVFCDNTTAVAYLRKEGGTRSPLLNSLAQEILRWTESLSIRLAPQFLPGSQNVLADALSRPHQLPHSEWSLNMDVFLSLRRLWPVQIDLFATSDNRRCSIYFSPLHDPMSAGTDAFLQSWDGLQAYAFPPVSLLPRVLAKLRASSGTELTLVAPHWAQRP